MNPAPCTRCLIKAVLVALVVPLSCASSSRQGPGTQRVAQATTPEMAKVEEDGPPVSSEAMFHYLRARLLLDRGDGRGAVDAAREAMVFDHSSAVLHALLGEAQLLDGRAADALRQAERALELDKESVEAHALRASALWTLGQRDRAEPSLQAVLKQDPTRIREAERLVELLVQRGDVRGAGEVGQALIQARPEDEEALVLVAQTCTRLGAWECAREQLDQAARQSPSSTVVCWLRAEVAEQRARWEEALEARRACLRLDGQNRDAQLGLLVSLARLGRTAEARAHWKSVAQGNPGESLAVEAVQRLLRVQSAELAVWVAEDALASVGNAPALVVELGQAHADLGRCTQAERVLSKVPLGGDPGLRALEITASCQLRRRQARQALNTLRSGLDIHPRASGLIVLTCRAHRMLKEAAAAGSVAAALDPTDETLTNARVRCLVDAGQVPAAMELASSRAADKPDDPEALMELAEAQWYAGRTSEAVGTARALLAVRPDLPQAQNLLSYSLVRTGGDLKEARRLAELAVGRVPGAGEIVDTLGEVLMALGETRKGLETLEHAAVLLPLDAEVWLHVGQARRAAGQQEAAAKAFQRGLLLLPLEPDVEASLRAQLGKP